MSNLTPKDKVLGKVGEIMQVESEIAIAKKAIAERELQVKAWREEVVAGLKTMNLKTVKHQSGVSVTVAKRATLSVTDPAALINDLKGKKLFNFIEEVPEQTEVIPGHEEVRMELFKTYLKTAAWKPTDFVGMDIKETEFLQIKK